MILTDPQDAGMLVSWGDENGLVSIIDSMAHKGHDMDVIDFIRASILNRFLYSGCIPDSYEHHTL